jgi:hypothetical protein
LTRERDETASVVAHLAELDTRDVHLRQGYPSLFVYCRDAIGMSEGEAYNRIEVARTARRFPVVLEMLADGRLHLTAAVKRAVWIRDCGRCRYIGPNGHRCEERRFVEFHHLDPRALGGEASIDLIELRCRRHNDYEGRLYFGRRRRPRVLVPEQVDLSVTHSTP